MRSIALGVFRDLCARFECDFSSVATEDELVLDYFGETVLRLWSDQFGPTRQSTALSTAIVDADVNSVEAASSDSREKHPQMRQR